MAGTFGNYFKADIFAILNPRSIDIRGGALRGGHRAGHPLQGLPLLLLIVNPRKF